MALVLVGPQVIPPPPGVDMGDVKSLAAGKEHSPLNRTATS